MDISGQLLLANKPLASGVDPYLDSVSLYLKGDGANNSTTFTDSSPSPKTITRNGSPVISTAQSKYGGSSMLFNGDATADFLTTPSNVSLDFGTGDFTVETWIYPTQIGTQTMDPDALLDMRPDLVNGNYLLLLIRYSTSSLGFLINSVSYEFTPSLLNINTWYHVALSRNSGILKGFVNGVEHYSGTHTNNLLSGTTIKIGTGAYRGNGEVYYNGYMDSFRITKGIARYTANFNPETDTYLN